MKTNRWLLLSLMSLIITGLSCKSQNQSDNKSSKALDLRSICQLPDQLIESSGIAIEGSNRIWSHEDSGNANSLFCFDSTGTLLRTIEIINAENIDWEDLTTDNDEHWFIEDAGNNDNDRTDLIIYVIPSPETFSGNQISAGIIRFTLSDQTGFPPPSSNRNYDIEAMAWHQNSLYLFTKDRSNPFTGYTKMYVLPDLPGTYVARLAGSCFIAGEEETGRITSADINHHTGELILLTHAGLVSFTAYPENRFFEGTRTDYHFTTEPGQNEGIAFVSTTRLYMSEEGSNSNPGKLYDIRLPQAQLGIIKPDQKLLIAVYPNPFSKSIFISNQQHSRVELIDCTGNLLFSSTSPGDINIDTESLKPGLYIIRTTAGNGVFQNKIIKI